MGHPTKLLESIRSKVEGNYPPEQGYRYAYEENISPRGAPQMLPDIIVRDPRGKTVCLVEIGYTRPEKLAYYRGSLNVPDVRWYDKEGNLHDGPPRPRATRYLSDKALSERFDVTRQCIWRWARNGTFPSPVKLSPNCTRWRLEDVEEWEAQFVGEAI